MTASEESAIKWPSPPSDLLISPGTVHVWAWDYECSSDTLNLYTSLLSPDERLQMQRFHFEADRVRYCVSHAILRILLGRYLCVQPSSISFYKNSFGKPLLAQHFATEEVTFNLSHTSNLGIVAIASSLAVGVDIEEVHPVEYRAIERHFSTTEQSHLAALADADRLEGFFNCWTRKEAIVKAEGLGLYASLDAFNVSLDQNLRPALLEIRANTGFISKWYLVELRPAQGFVGALATDAPAAVACYRFGS
jgi:4'-phosphopantetheinyl transferase